MRSVVLFVLLMFLFPLVNVAQYGGDAKEENVKVSNVKIVKRGKVPRDWHFCSLELDTVYGAEIYRAYDYLKGREPKTKTIVAIIDSGVEVTHDNLKNALWRNLGEIPGNGIDDDDNGYVDDVHGWNFLGSPDGRRIRGTQVADWEFLRLYKKYKNVDTLKFSKKEYKEYRYFKDVVCRFSFLPPYVEATTFMEQYATSMEQKRADRLSLGDDVNSLKERHYGNNNLLGKESEHGTHVAGIVGAVPGDKPGINGIASVELMIIKILDGGVKRIRM